MGERMVVEVDREPLSQMSHTSSFRQLRELLRRVCASHHKGLKINLTHGHTTNDTCLAADFEPRKNSSTQDDDSEGRERFYFIKFLFLSKFLGLS